MGDLGGGFWGGIVAPIGSVYAAFIVMLVRYARSGEKRQRRNMRRTGSPAAHATLLRRMAATAAGGYVVFLLVVLVFSYMFVGQQGALGEAVVFGGFLAAVPGFGVLVLLGWVEGRIRARRGRSS